MQLVLKIDVLLEKERVFFSIVKIYITVVTIVVRDTSGKLLSKAYGIVHNVSLLRVSLTFSVLNDKEK